MSGPDCPECGEHFMGCPCNEAKVIWAVSPESDRFERAFGPIFDLEVRLMKLEERMNNLERMKL